MKERERVERESCGCKAYREVDTGRVMAEVNCNMHRGQFRYDPDDIPWERKRHPR